MELQVAATKLAEKGYKTLALPCDVLDERAGGSNGEEDCLAPSAGSTQSRCVLTRNNCALSRTSSDCRHTNTELHLKESLESTAQQDGRPRAKTKQNVYESA